MHLLNVSIFHLFNMMKMRNSHDDFGNWWSCRDNIWASFDARLVGGDKIANSKEERAQAARRQKSRQGSARGSPLFAQLFKRLFAPRKYSRHPFLKYPRKRQRGIMRTYVSAHTKRVINGARNILTCFSLPPPVSERGTRLVIIISSRCHAI